MPTNINGNTGIDKVQDGTVVNADIDTLDASKLTGSIAAARIANNTIDSAHITAGAIDDAHLATGITASKLTGALPAIDGSNLTGAGPTHTSSGSAPGSPAIGDFWHDTTNDRLYIRTNDGSSNIWLQI